MLCTGQPSPLLVLARRCAGPVASQASLNHCLLFTRPAIKSMKKGNKVFILIKTAHASRKINECSFFYEQEND